MYLAAGREFKYLCMALSVCALVCAVMQRRENKMKLCFKQRFFSWFDSYDIYDASTGATAFTVEGSSPGDTACTFSTRRGRHIATVKQRVLTFLPKFDLYIGERSIGTIRKGVHALPPRVRAGLQRLARAGQLSGVGLYDRRRGGPHRRAHSQGAPPLDGYLHHRRTGRETRCAHSWWSSPLTPKKMLARQQLNLY